MGTPMSGNDSARITARVHVELEAAFVLREGANATGIRALLFGSRAVCGYGG